MTKQKGLALAMLTDAFRDTNIWFGKDYTTRKLQLLELEKGLLKNQPLKKEAVEGLQETLIFDSIEHPYRTWAIMKAFGWIAGATPIVAAKPFRYLTTINEWTRKETPKSKEISKESGYQGD